MTGILDQIERSLLARRLVNRGQRILIAVSGGLDSMVLLRILQELSKKHGWRLKVAHFNHQLRGPSSAADERLVQRTASALGVPFAVERADVRRFARTRKVSLEMAARELRHDFLARTALGWDCRIIALAHHADDQVELFFLRLLRGSGTEALAGMKWRSPSPANRAIDLVRPLLDQPKSALREFAENQCVRYREDASNASLDIQRNRLRHELLPLLRRKYQPALTKVALRLMDLIGAESEAVFQAASAWLAQETARCSARTGKVIKDHRTGFRVNAFLELPVAVQRRILQLQLFQQGLAPDYDLIEQLRLSPGRRVSVSTPRVSNRGSRPATSRATPSSDLAPRSLLCFRDSNGRLHIERGQVFNGERLELNLASDSWQTTFGGITVAWSVRKLVGLGQKPRPGREIFDADLVGPQILLRHWQPGDRFQPIGMANSIKLQDFFTNEKVPRALRHRLVVATTAKGEVFWVENLRISERFKLRKTTIRRLLWRWQRL